MLLEETLKPPIWRILVFWTCVVGFGAFVYYVAPPAYQFYRSILEFTAFKQEKATLQKQLDETYTKGFQDGVKSFNIPKTCTAWWFGTNLKERHDQARQAYCKGKI